MSRKIPELERLLQCLELAEVPSRARNKTVAEKTKYSLSMVGKYLSGNLPLNMRFKSSVCSAFSINMRYIEAGEGSWYVLGTGAAPVDNPEIVRNSEFIDLLNSSVAFLEAIKEVKFMDEPERWEAVAMLKRMNSKRNTE